MFGHFFISRSFNIILFLQGLARVAAIMANGGSLQGNNECFYKSVYNLFCFA